MIRMTLEQWANVSAIAQAIFVPISLIFVLVQLRRQTQLARAANAQALVEISSPFNMLLIQDTRAIKLWNDGAAKFDALEPVERARYVNLLTWWLLLHENIYHQWQHKLIEAKLYDSWKRDLEAFLVKQRFTRDGEPWSSLRSFYHQDFAAHVDRLVAGKESLDGGAASSHITSA